jgi:hypothetical protein
MPIRYKPADQETRYSSVIVKGDDKQPLLVSLHDVPVAEKIVLDANCFLCLKHTASSRLGRGMVVLPRRLLLAR